MSDVNTNKHFFIITEKNITLRTFCDITSLHGKQVAVFQVLCYYISKQKGEKK